MEETRRFIRYLFPGMIFFVLLSLYLFLSRGEVFVRAVVGFIQGAKNGGFLQVGVFILFASGAGYFFATIYHWITKKRWRMPNHSELLRDVVCKKKWVQVIDRRISRVENPDDDKDATDIFCPSQAWSILGAYYHARISKKKFKKAHVRIESLNDTLHGLGSSWVAAVFALIIWFPAHCMIWCGEVPCHFFPLPSTAVVLVAVGVIIILVRNWYLTGVEVTNFVDGISAEFMEKEFNKEMKRIRLFFPGPR